MALVKATLEQQLTAIFSNTKNTSEQCAKQIAAGRFGIAGEGRREYR